MPKWKVNTVLSCLVVLAFGCQKETIECSPGETAGLNLPETPFDYSADIPAHISADPVVNLLGGNAPSSNQTTDEGATLGRVLFYDPRLSLDNSISCSSCHFQENSFSTNSAFEEGIDNQITSRSSMALVNLRWSPRLFWDARINSLEEQVLIPIQDHREMNSNLEELVVKLSSAEEYSELFLEAFGSEEITSERISRALSQFIRSLVSFNSKYDIAKQTSFEIFTDEELTGMNLFFSGEARCNNCHTPELMSNTAPMNNGLEAESIDLGQFEATGNQSDIGEFKVVTLRNIAVTAPYMHDGRFSTLTEVVEFYNTDIQPHQNLNDRLTLEVETGGTPVTLGLSDEDISNLVAFLHTLTDESFLTDEKFSNPFLE